MRMRFKAEAKDVLIFCIFAVVWLLVVALAVANVSAFLKGESFTINLFLGFTGGIIGPGSPCFFNNLGNTIELHLRKSHLVVESDGNEMTTLILDAEVNKYVLGMEGSISSGDYVRCHYHIILRVTP